MCRIIFVAVVSTFAALTVSTTSPSAHADRTIRGSGFAVQVGSGWRGRIVAATQLSPPAVNLGNFRLPPARDNFGNSTRTRWPASAVLITIIDWSPGAYPSWQRVSLPLKIRRRDFAAPIEGVPSSHAFARRGVVVGGRPLEIWVNFGSKHITRTRLEVVNARLAAVRLTSR